ncbi:MAG: hypothetical protein JO136_06610 [Hyphomicrobiales bacterium]|nr:hypothetical protein [Hyphomicrobiales bacterium]MBV9907367.1 hypothetical protein [Hyphomicrobiales bacterium]
MSYRIAKLEAALRVNAAVCARAERLITAYIAPGSDRTAILGELVRLLNGPGQREAKRLAEVALDKGRSGEEEALASTTRTRNAPRRFWAAVFMGITGFLFVVTLIQPDWIEAISGGFDPDQHTGSVEWTIGMAMLVVTLAILGAFPWMGTVRGRLNR